MLRKHFHFLEGLVVVVLLVAMTWMNSFAAVPNDFTGSNTSGLQPRGQLGVSRSKESENPRRIREGTEIEDRAGYFRQDGDGAIFVTDEGYELGGLPNLNLERIVRTLKTADETKTIRWRVSGKVTEFSGRNYLFITRAVYKSTAPPPIPTQLDTESSAAN